MKKNLPNVFANPINKPLNNNREVYYSDVVEHRNLRSENIPQKINEIFASVHHVYKSNVKIITKEGEIFTTIVGKNGNNLLTLNGEKININDILDIQRL